MDERDSDVFARFARRFADIETEVKDPPAVGDRRSTRPYVRRQARAVAISAAVVVTVLAAVALGPTFVGQVATGPTASRSTVEASGTTPTSASTYDPAVPALPMVVCGRIGAEPCELAIDLVRQGHPGEVAAAWAIVVDDTCPPSRAGPGGVTSITICDRLYPFDSAVVLVPAPGSSAEPRPFLVVGTADRPERVVEGGPIPEHILSMTETLSRAPRVVVGPWVASCIDVESDSCQGVAALAINNLGRGDASGNLLVRSRRACPAVPNWADGSRCWQADIPLVAGPVCMVIAKRTTDGQYAQVAGDVPGRLHLPTDPVGCPPDD